MGEREILATLQDIFSDVFVREDVLLSRETGREHVPGWDSMRQIDIVLSVEAHFSIKFSSRDIDRLIQVGDFIDLIVDKSA